MDGFGERLRKEFELRGLSTKRAARELGISRAAIYLWMKGTNVPSLPMFKKLCEMYEIEPATLLNF